MTNLQIVGIIGLTLLYGYTIYMLFKVQRVLKNVEQKSKK